MKNIYVAMCSHPMYIEDTHYYLFEKEEYFNAFIEFQNLINYSMDDKILAKIKELQTTKNMFLNILDVDKQFGDGELFDNGLEDIFPKDEIKYVNTINELNKLTCGRNVVEEYVTIT